MKRSTNTNTKTLDLLKVYKQNSNITFKPMGIWYGIDDEWLRWMKGNMNHWVRPYNIEIDVEESKMLIISTIPQLDAFIKKYHKRGSEFEFMGEINWKRVAKDYSGIEIQNYYELKWGDYPYRMGAMWFHGWDVSSGCIWDLSIIKNQKLEQKNHKKNGKVYQQRLERENASCDRKDENVT